MPVWRPPPVSLNPRIVVIHWRPIRTLQRDVRAVGYNADGAEGRVSSPRVQSDAASTSATTRSGRVHGFDGNRGEPLRSRHGFDP